MEIEVIEKNIKTSPPIFECARCKDTQSIKLTYGMLKNTFYCSSCWNDMPFVNSVLDERLNNLEKKVEDLINGAVSRNKDIKRIEENNNLMNENIKILETKINELTSENIKLLETKMSNLVYGIISELEKEI